MHFYWHELAVAILLALTREMLTVPHCKESLSKAYIGAVVGRARHNLLWGREHDYGVDGSIRQLAKRGTRIFETGFGIDFQAKSTVNWTHTESDVSYDLDVTAYNDLVFRAHNGALPFILIVLCLPHADTDWLKVSESSLILRYCVYWSQLTGSQSENSSTVRVFIPRSNVLTPDAVVELLCKFEKGEALA